MLGRHIRLAYRHTGGGWRRDNRGMPALVLATPLRRRPNAPWSGVVHTRHVPGVAADGIAQERVERLRSAIAEARPLARGQSETIARTVLLNALRRHDVFAPPGTVALIAWQLANPWRGLLRPFHSWRVSKRLLAEPDPDEARFHHEVNAVSKLTREVPQVRGTSSRRTVDGPVHTVWVDPWSQDLADYLHDLAAPIELAVLPVAD